MASNVNFISQFRTGGDPCTYKESGELQAEMSKLTHPARPDVDWRRVEKLSLALFRQNGVELQTLVCYVLAITRRQGLAGMADGLGSLDILLQRWADFWPVQVHSRISLLSWVTEKMQQALRALDIQYQDLPQIYRCVQHLSAIETTLQQCELWHMTKLDVLSGQFRNTALRLELLAPQGATAQESEPSRRDISAPESAAESPLPDVVTYRAQQNNDENEKPDVQRAEFPRPRRWPVFIAGMVAMACLGGAGIWGWGLLHQPDALTHRVQMSVISLPQPLDTGDLVKVAAKEKVLLNQHQIVEAGRTQLEQLDKLSPRWALELGYRQLRQLNALWPDNVQIKALDAQWRKQRELSALSAEALNGYAQAQSQLQRLSAQLDALDERKGRYLTGSELKTAVYGIRQSLKEPPLEELLRQLEEQKQTGEVSPTLLTQIDTRLNQLLNRYVILLDTKVEQSQ
ncbi:type VI secretion system protein VasL [Escherichia coli]